MDELIQHGLHALRETLQQDKELTFNNTSIGIVGPPSPLEDGPYTTGSFRIHEDEKVVEGFIKTMIPKETAEAPAAAAPAAPAATGDEDVQMDG